MELEKYYSRYTKEEQRKQIKETKKKMDNLNKPIKLKKRKSVRSYLGGGRMKVSAQGGIKNFLGMLHR